MLKVGRHHSRGNSRGRLQNQVILQVPGKTPKLRGQVLETGWNAQPAVENELLPYQLHPSTPSATSSWASWQLLLSSCMKFWCIAPCSTYRQLQFRCQHHGFTFFTVVQDIGRASSRSLAMTGLGASCFAVACSLEAEPLLCRAIQIEFNMQVRPSSSK